jgi:NADPH2 dehydrogenase
MGRAANSKTLAADGPDFRIVGPSAIPITGSHQVPRPLTREEIKEYVDLHVEAAKKSVEVAGFDGVEIHMANGYLLDQFLQETANQRTDEYGVSVQNRVRFPLDVVDAIADAIGADRIGVRVSPWGTYQGMRMDDPIPTFSHLASQLAERQPSLAYIHAIEPRISCDVDQTAGESESNDFLREIWGPRPFIAAGGFTRKEAIEAVEEKGGLVAFGRLFISNVCPLQLFVSGC